MQEIFSHLPINAITNAGFKFLKIVVHIEVREHEPVDGVYGAGVAEGDKVEVAAAPRAPRVVPYSLPTVRMYCDSEPAESYREFVGKGPFPTRVE
jgi:hypothetical protein